MAKNSEVYKTANEREEAFRDWCKIEIEDGCLTCPLRNCTKGMQDCAFAWLDLEATENSFSGDTKEFNVFCTKHDYCEQCEIGRKYPNGNVDCQEKFIDMKNKGELK